VTREDIADAACGAAFWASPLVFAFLLCSAISWWITGSWDWLWIMIWQAHWGHG
jgi:hypothetical protein